MSAKPREAELYAPVKALLESQGYEVKAEIGAADVVACRPGEDEPLVVELKTGFSLTLFHQAVARQSVSDVVYLAVPHVAGRRFQRSLKENITLCRRLGLGLITVRLKDGHVQLHLDPAPYSPRKSPRSKSRLLREFARREGDPNTGGSTRRGLVTAYRQDAMRIAAHLVTHGPSRGAEVARATGVENATRMMADDHYGWFERVERGIYALTPNGQKAAAGLPE
ncbi:DUF2161 domain-containing phosphodiesterase [Aliiruegeria sabulilitoris]|uniref:DUF2161 domain-containing phosphodiesterase n=1 Tax=Aliiruegeria sabulilitoris TaxID=1510458 RepID=UPI000831B2C6|nr:DUF2161 family putative PD-(D/E)XK-type phosphodiesterase [Aliiruegeria sabulilitoris]NDR54998.1 hypothetical protein [Pseudoruegeria sp. M32A2M]